VLPSIKSNVWHLVLALLFTAASPLAESQSLEYKQLKNLLAEIKAADQSGDHRLACEKSRYFVTSFIKQIPLPLGPNDRENIKSVESLRDAHCQKAEVQQQGQWFDLIGRAATCKGYDSAVKTCAPASDFRACLSRLGFNSQAQTMCK
jgi:hypothetical protein